MANKPVVKTDRETRGAKGIVKPREFFTPDAPAPTKSGPKKKTGTVGRPKKETAGEEAKAKVTKAKKKTETKAKGALNKVKGAKVEKKGAATKKTKKPAAKANGAKKEVKK